jgi:hypothetical protein
MLQFDDYRNSLTGAHLTVSYSRAIVSAGREQLVVSPQNGPINAFLGFIFSKRPAIRIPQSFGDDP